MHPDLLNNSLFLRYYNQWQEDPTSIVFAAIADFFLRYGLVDDALRICLEGLNHHPDFVSGRLVLAKAFLQKKETLRAKEELKKILNQMPGQARALEMMRQVEEKKTPPTVVVEAPSWETISMAKIYQSQGLIGQAREVYQSILARDPNNQEAKTRLDQLGREA